jgi:MFS family permease
MLDPQAPRRDLLRLVVATGLASIGLAAGGTGGALLATELAGSTSVAGLPFGLLVAGSAGGAVLISWLTPRSGRAAALAVGYLTGVAGALVVIAGALAAMLPLVFLGSVLLGPANAAVFLSRYGGADLADDAHRGRGLGLILFATAIGAVTAPNLLAPSGIVAAALGLTPVAGLYVVSIVVFGAAGILLVARSRRSPRSLPPHSDGGLWHGVDARIGGPGVAGLIVLGATNMAMVGIMAVAPVRLAAHGQHLGSIGLIISIHVAAMLAPSPLTGWLSDRLGPGRVAVAAGVAFLGAGAWGALAHESDVLAITGFLLTVGLGWNLAVVSGSAMLTAGLAHGSRQGAEAAGEVVMGLAAAIGATTAGVLASVAGWPAVAIAGGIVGMLAAAGAISHPAAPNARATRPASLDRGPREPRGDQRLKGGAALDSPQ